MLERNEDLIMARKLKDIETTEVSFVDEPANKKKFLFFKARGEGKGTGGNLQGDGGAKYCVCPACGYSIEHEKLGAGVSVPCARIECPKCGTKMVGSDTKTIKKTIGEHKMDDEIVELLKSYFEEEDLEIDFEKAEKLSDKAISAIKGALKLVNKYKADFPDDLKKAVGTLAKYAGYGYGYPAKTEKGEVAKAGAKFSKDTLDKLRKAVEALNALKAILPDVGEETKKSETSEVEKSIEKIAKSIEELESKKAEENENKLTKTLEELSKRLETVEKGTGIKKSVEGQDDDDDAETSKVDDPWPSIKIMD